MMSLLLERFRSLTDTDTVTGISSRVDFRACGFKRGFAHTTDKERVATVTDDTFNMAEQEELLYLAQSCKKLLTFLQT